MIVDTDPLPYISNIKKVLAQVEFSFVLALGLLILVPNTIDHAVWAAGEIETDYRIALVGESEDELQTTVLIDRFHRADGFRQSIKTQGSSSAVVADDTLEENLMSEEKVDKETGAESVIENTIGLPKIQHRIRRHVVATVTGYNPVPEQTDSTPCLTANMTEICSEQKNIVAANWLPFGTKVRIPDYFGDTVFEVADRMNERYQGYELDVLLYEKSDALALGRRKLSIEILAD